MSSQIARSNMIAQQLRTNEVLDPSILDLFNTIPREAFVPTAYRAVAYSDLQIELAHHQRMLTPTEEGKILQALALQGHELVLEIGTGTGYFTALLSRLCKQVISVDYFSDFTNQARQKLQENSCENVTLVTGDASHGWLDKAPYDVIIFTGAIDELTETIRLQLMPRGKLFAIIGSGVVMQGQYHTLDTNGTWSKKIVFETNIPALIDPTRPNQFVF